MIPISDRETHNVLKRVVNGDRFAAEEWESIRDKIDAYHEKYGDSGILIVHSEDSTCLCGCPETTETSIIGQYTHIKLYEYLLEKRYINPTDPALQVRIIKILTDSTYKRLTDMPTRLFLLKNILTTESLNGYGDTFDGDAIDDYSIFNPLFYTFEKFDNEDEIFKEMITILIEKRFNFSPQCISDMCFYFSADVLDFYLTRNPGIISEAATSRILMTLVPIEIRSSASYLSLRRYLDRFYDVFFSNPRYGDLLDRFVSVCENDDEVPPLASADDDFPTKLKRAIDEIVNSDHSIVDENMKRRLIDRLELTHRIIINRQQIRSAMNTIRVMISHGFVLSREQFITGSRLYFKLLERYAPELRTDLCRLLQI
jgi:hypothetical protein